MKNYSKIRLYEINKNVRCIKCRHKGAVQFYGQWYPNGLGDDARKVPELQKYRDNFFMNPTCSFGGIMPWECTNCDNYGLIDFVSLEGYVMAFETTRD